MDFTATAISRQAFATGAICNRTCEYLNPCFNIPLAHDDPKMLAKFVENKLPQRKRNRLNFPYNLQWSHKLIKVCANHVLPKLVIRNVSQIRIEFDSISTPYLFNWNLFIVRNIRVLNLSVRVQYAVLVKRRLFIVMLLIVNK